MSTLAQIVEDFAIALKAVDASAPQGASKTRVYKPGVGPLTEADAISKAVLQMARVYPERYDKVAPFPYPGSRQKCDLVMPGSWAIEFKLIRPYGDNGIEAEHWSENLLHPYPGNISAIGDAIKLTRSGFTEAKAIIVFGYEHSPSLIDLDTAIQAFEATAKYAVGLKLSERFSAFANGLIHPVHQQLKVFGWQVFGFEADHERPQ